VISHSINLGQGAALQTGIEYARAIGADVIVTFDADGQHQPSDIPALLAALEREGADIALGSRFLGRAEGIHWLRKCLLKLTARATRLTLGLRLTDVHNGLRALRVATTGRIELRQNRMAHASELLSQIAKYRLRYVEVPCTVVYTPYSLAKGQKLYHSINIFADLLLRRLHK
jgi:glycosyltransferase involved in cell wall biosynthesis